MEAQTHKQEREVLADEELDLVVGGREASAPSVSEVVVTKRMDCASSKLF